MICDKKETAIVILILVILIAFFWDVLFGGKILLTCNPNLWHPWRHYATRADLEAKTYRTDSALTYLPRIAELHHSLKSGRLPLWNPFIFMGYPFLGDPQSRVVYPISLLIGLLDAHRALAIDVFVHFFIAILGMYLFLRSLTSDTIGSLYGGFLFGFSGFMATRIGHPTFVSAAAWIPWIFYSYRLVEQSRRHSWLALALCFAMCYLAGFPQITFFAVGALFLYATWIGLEDLIQKKQKESLKNGLFAVFLAGGIALLLVSPSLFAFFEFLKNSKGLGIGFKEMAECYVSNPWLLARAAFPYLFGNPVEGTSWLRIFNPAIHPYNPLFIVYVSVGGLILAIGSLTFLRSSREIRFFWFLLLLSVAIGVIPEVLKPFYLLIPVFRISQIDRICILANFSLAALSGITLSKAPTSLRSERRTLVLSVLFFGAILLISLLVLGFDAKAVYESLIERMKTLPAEIWDQPASKGIASWLEDGDGFSQSIMKHARTWAVVVGISTVLLLIALKKSKPRTIFLLIFFGFSLLDLLSVARSYYVSQYKGIEPTEGTNLLRDLTSSTAFWRVESFLGEKGVLPPNTNEILGLQSIGGLSTITPLAFDELLNALPSLSLDKGEPLTPHRLYEIGCGRFLLSQHLDTSLAISPFIKSAKSAGAILKTIGFGGKSLIAVETTVNESRELEATLPHAKRIEIYFGFQKSEKLDSLLLRVEVQRGGQQDKPSICFERGFGTKDSDRWQKIPLDISAIGGGKTLLKITSLGTRSDSTRCYWGGFEIIMDDCQVRKLEKAYKIGSLGKSLEGILRVDIVGSGLLPLEISKPQKIVRFLDFAARPSCQSILVEIENPAEEVIIKSSMDFDILDARLIYLDKGLPVELIPIYVGDMVIIENMKALPRGIVLSKGYVDTDPRRKQAIFLGQSLGDAMCGSSRIQFYSPTRVVVEVEAEEQGYLVFQDICYPGWTADVDGRSVPIYSFNGLRCIEVKKGIHQVVMRYRPKPVMFGSLLCMLGIMLCLRGVWQKKTSDVNGQVTENRI